MCCLGTGVVGGVEVAEGCGLTPVFQGPLVVGFGTIRASAIQGMRLLGEGCDASGAGMGRVIWGQ